MKTSILSLLLAVPMLLHCGAASADPTSSRHEVSDHSELYRSAFCLASYAMWSNLFSKDPTVPASAKFEILARMTGLSRTLKTGAAGAGHTTAEVDEWIGFISEGMSLNSPDVWVEAVKRMQCREATDQWSTFEIL